MEVHWRGVELEEVTVGQSGGRRGWCSVDRGAVVSVGMTRGAVEAGCEWKTKVERGSSSAAETVGGEAAATVSWARARRWQSLSEEVCMVRTRSARGSDRAADGWAPRGFDFSNLAKTHSNLEFEKECLNLLQTFPNFVCY
jgi:hypothetical protein